MTYESAACSECAKNCMLIHKKMKKNAAPTSFFKVMFGSGFSERLFLPPKFAPTVASLIDKTIHLEDIKGQHWDVCISNCEGSFAIEGGWSGFSLDHGLELGDFLLFHYLGSYFVVKIYDKTGCEKSDFPWSLKDNKQRCTDVNSLTHEDLCYTRSNDESSNNPCSSSSIVSRTNVATIQSEKEATHVESVANNPRESTPDVEIIENHCKESEVVLKKDLELKSVTQKASHGCKKTVNHLENSNAGLGLKKHNYHKLQEDAKKNLKGEAIRAADNGLTSTSRNPYLDKETINDRSKVPVKKEPVELTHGLSSMIKMTLKGRGSTLKGGHLQSYDITSSRYKLKNCEDLVASSSRRADTVKVTISGPSQLELPASLPTSLPSAFSGGKTGRERRLVFLQDPSKRIWPVLYEERPECGVLANGWEGFIKANGLQPGDECIFQHTKDSTYTVSISRKREKLPVSFPIQ